MNKLNLLPTQTALVAIDLQNLIVSRSTEPHDARTVVEHTARMATALRAKGGFIVWVRVAGSPDGKDRLHPVCDQPWTPPRELPPDANELSPGLLLQPSDHIITKRQWGAFYGTDLDLQLRRRGMSTILLAGIATNIGVESTARAAFELGYEQIFVEDAMAALTAAQHEHTVTHIFPRMGRVHRAAEVLAALLTKTPVWWDNYRRGPRWVSEPVFQPELDVRTGAKRNGLIQASVVNLPSD